MIRKLEAWTIVEITHIRIFSSSIIFILIYIILIIVRRQNGLALVQKVGRSAGCIRKVYNC